MLQRHEHGHSVPWHHEHGHADDAMEHYCQSCVLGYRGHVHMPEHMWTQDPGRGGQGADRTKDRDDLGSHL